MKKTMLSQGAASLLILLWTYTATSKLLAYDEFLYQLKQSPYLDFAAIAISIAIPLIELAISALLLLKNWRMLGFTSSFILLAVFSGYITLMLLTANRLPCSCGGVIADLSWGAHLAVNGGFMAISCLGIVASSEERFETVAKAV